MNRLLPALLLVPLLAACMAKPPTITTLTKPDRGTDQQAPYYVRHPDEPFTRVNAVAIAQREWRAFGSVVDDDPPSETPLPQILRPDQQPGLWQRVGDYWWIGQDSGTEEGDWNSRYNESGTPYLHQPPAWSAAFISYVMRVAGAGRGFPYTPLHADYINAAARNEGVLRAERPETYPPQPGDLICASRRRKRPLAFDDLPTDRFFAHCDIVASNLPGQVPGQLPRQLVVIGGNVAAGVTMKHVPITPEGTLADRNGRLVDARYPWFVVIRVLYADPAPSASTP